MKGLLAPTVDRVERTQPPRRPRNIEPKIPETMKLDVFPK
jgi:hypothetical protein